MSESREARPAATVNDEGVEYLRPRPLSLAHFMLWTILCAGFFSLDTLMADVKTLLYYRSTEEGFHSFALALSYAYSAIVAAGLTGTIVLLRDRWLGASGLLQPGHWIILVGAAVNLPGSAFDTLLPLVFSDDPSVVWRLRSLSYMFLSGLALLGYLMAMTRPYFPRRWKVVLLAKAVLAAMIIASQILPMWASVLYRWMIWSGGYPVYSIFNILAWVLFDGWWMIPLCVLMLVVGRMDLQAGIRRDWIHWLAVVLVFCQTILRAGIAAFWWAILR